MPHSFGPKVFRRNYQPVNGNYGKTLDVNLNVNFITVEGRRMNVLKMMMEK